MLGKDFIRSRYILKRKKNYKKIEIKFFNPLINLLKKKKYAIKNIGIYYPSNFELDILKILDPSNYLGAAPTMAQRLLDKRKLP